MIEISETIFLFFLTVVFIIIGFAAKRVFKVVLNCLWITMFVVVFPIILNKLLGFAVPVDSTALLFYITTGLLLYFVFLFAKAVYFGLSVLEKGGKKAASPITGIIGHFKESKQKKKDRFIEEQMKKQKKLKKKKGDEDFVYIDNKEDE